MEKESILGRMEGSMKGSIKMIKRMGMEFIVGLMERNMMVTGLMESNMVKGYLCLQMERLDMVFGRRENVLSGWKS